MKSTLLLPSCLASAMAIVLFSPARAHAEQVGDTSGKTSIKDLETVEVREKRLRRDYHYVASDIRSATKTDTSLLDLPQSVSVLTQALIRDQAISGMADAVRYVPGVGMAQGEGNRDTPIFRGSSTTADMFVDGVRDDVQYYRDTYNIERIEILKGPSAMIFGRGGSGGVLNRVAKIADWSDPREVRLEAGSWDHRRATTDLGYSPNDHLSFRLSALYQDSDSFRDGYNNERRGINPTLSARLGEQTVLTLGYEHFEDKRVADRGVPSLNGKPLDVARETFFGDPGRSPTSSDVDAFTAVLEHNFDNGVRLTNRIRYADYDKSYQNIFAGGAYRTSAGVQETSIAAYRNSTLRKGLFNQTDLDFRFDTGAISHNVLLGAEYQWQETSNFRETGYFTGIGPTTTTAWVPLANPRFTGPIDFRQSLTDADGFTRAEDTSVYVQDQIGFSPKWEAVLGLRYEKFDLDYLNHRSNARLSSTDNLLSPRAGLIFKPIDTVSIYASYGMTYLPRAGEQLGSLAATTAALDPEEFKNLELGAKWSFRPDFLLSAALYQLDRSNVAVTDPDDVTRLLLIDGQRVRGLEIEGSGNLTENWRITGGYAYQDAKLTANLSATQTAGNRLGQVPEHSFSLWNRYDLTSKFGLGLGVLYRSESYVSTDNRVTLPSYTRLDAAAFYTINDHVQLQLNAENLFDKNYYPTAHSNSNIMPGTPRSYKLGLNVRF